MINPLELRLGNYIYFDGAIHEILGVQKSAIWTKWHNDADADPRYFEDLESYDSIPLTPEFLRVCGFVKVKTYYKHNTDSGEAEIRVVLDEYCNAHLSVGDNEFGIAIGIYKSLHHLQNVFYSFTNRELKVDFNSYGVNKTTNDTREI